MNGAVVAYMLCTGVASLSPVSPAQVNAAATIEPGDTVQVSILAFDDPQVYVVLDDGTISGAPFGNVNIAGKTVEQAAAVITERSKKYILDPVVFVTIVQKNKHFVTVVGMRTGTSRLEWDRNMDLRSVIVIGELNEAYDRLRVNLFRDGKQMLVANVAGLVNGDPGTENPKLLPDDVVTITPAEQVKVWATGRFRTPGEVNLPEGANLSMAVASAGGAMTEPPAGILNRDPEFFRNSKVRVIRGGKFFDFAVSDEAGMTQFVVESGDTLVVVQPELVTVDIAGQVVEPGVKTMLDGGTLIDILVRAKGPTEEGTLKNVLLFRGGEVRKLDMSAQYQGGVGEPVRIENGDLIVVQENKAAITVLGDVRNPGKYLVDDNEEMYLTDALSKASGLAQLGTLRRVMVARPGPDGKYTVRQVNVDEFLKDGKTEANLRLYPGDFVLFSQSKSVNGETFLRLLPIAFLLPNIID